MIDRRLLLSVGGCVLFSGVILLELGWGMTRPVPPAAVPSQTGGLSPSPNETRADPNQLVFAILARPLFSSTRRPPPIADNDISGTFELGGARLTAIVIAPDERIAIFDMQGAKPLVLSEGQTVSGWRVDSITPSEVSLLGPGGLKTLQPKLNPSHTGSNNSIAPASSVPPAPIHSRGPSRESQH
jgi:hypothetical protein